MTLATENYQLFQSMSLLVAKGDDAIIYIQETAHALPLKGNKLFLLLLNFSILCTVQLLNAGEEGSTPDPPSVRCHLLQRQTQFIFMFVSLFL